MSIYTTGGKPILKDGKIATGPKCCCTPPPNKRYKCDGAACIEDDEGEYDEPTCGGNCKHPDPCTVIVDGVRVPISMFDPYEVVSVSWRGLQTPGADKVFIDGVLVSDLPSTAADVLTYVTRAGCDGAGQTVDQKGVLLGPGYNGLITACFTGDGINNHVGLAVDPVDERTCRVHGGVSTIKVYTPCAIGGAASGDWIQEENWWVWECLVVNGVPGNVKVSPSIGARYFNSDPVACVVTHEAPKVTLDFVP